MSAPNACPACGQKIPSISPGGLCPKCLLLAGLGPADSDPRLDPTQLSPGASYTGFVPPSPAQLAGRFPQLEILELLGKGGMGAVYKARQKGLDRFVALKILPPEISRDQAFVDRFLREARALARLNHPNIIGVYDFGQTEGLCYFIMEYIDGVNLRQALQAGGMQAKEALAVVPQICDALQFAHDEGIVHRDIKPENILLDKRGRVKIADFGLAKLLGAGPTDPHLTGTQQVMGTLRYMAPEQMEGAREVDHRADIYSLGVVFYELLTGELPIGRFAPPSKKVEVDVRLDEVVLRALEKEPELRFQHASEVKTEVEAICGINPQATPDLSRLYGREWRSQQEFLGLPLVHVAFGIDPKTGRNRVAKGIIAIGDQAVGAIAIGGIAYGGLCIGGLGIGLISLSGCALGLWMAIGGCAIGLYALGGFALGAVAVGGGAVGYFAVGGGGAAVHGLFGHHQDPLAEKFFLGQLAWPGWLVATTALIPPLYTLLCMMAYLIQRKPSETGRPAERRERAASFAAKPAPTTVAPPRRPFFVPILATLNIVLALLLLLVTTAEDAPPDGVPPAMIWQTWAMVDNIFSFFLAAAIFLSSIGLYLWQPWARKVIVGCCVFGLVQLVVDMPYLTRFMIPSSYAGLKASLAADFPKADELDAVASTLTLMLIGSTLLIYLVWLIVTLVYFTRPAVVAAFEAGEVASTPVTFREQLDLLLAPAWVRTLIGIASALIYLGCLIALFSFHAQSTRVEGGRSANFEVGQPEPWLVMASEPQKGQSWRVNIVSPTMLVAALGVAMVAVGRYIEKLQKGQAHSMWLHYVIWGLMVAMVLVLGILNQSLGQ